MLTIDIKLNGKLVAYAALRNVSDLGDVSDYHVVWNEDEAKDLGIENDFGKFVIKGHRRRQTAWAIVAKVVERILGAMIGEPAETPGQAQVWEQAGSDHK